MPYAAVKSEFVKNLIRGASWKDRAHRKYVDDLIEIERYVLKGPSGFADALHEGMLKAKYNQEYMTIFKELKPEQYEQFIKADKQKQKKIKEESERLAKELRTLEKRLKKEWLAMGGTE
jgi:hypothetical protein